MRRARFPESRLLAAPGDSFDSAFKMTAPDGVFRRVAFIRVDEPEWTVIYAGLREANAFRMSFQFSRTIFCYVHSTVLAHQTVIYSCSLSGNNKHFGVLVLARRVDTITYLINFAERPHFWIIGWWKQSCLWRCSIDVPSHFNRAKEIYSRDWAISSSDFRTKMNIFGRCRYRGGKYSSVESKLLKCNARPRRGGVKNIYIVDINGGYCYGDPRINRHRQLKLARGNDCWRTTICIALWTSFLRV